VAIKRKYRHAIIGYSSNLEAERYVTSRFEKELELAMVWCFVSVKQSGVINTTFLPRVPFIKNAQIILSRLKCNNFIRLTKMKETRQLYIIKNISLNF
jgi:hypothetical protein